jgi:hypothetical protein
VAISDRASSSSRWRRPAGWSATAAAGLLVAGASAALVWKELRWRAFNDHCHYDDDIHQIVDDAGGDPRGCQQLAASAGRARTLAITGYAAGAVLGAAALALLWPPSRPDPSPTTKIAASTTTAGPRLRCAPTMARVGVSCLLRF